VREPGDILLIATYELGHQPLAVAWPAAFLERRGYRPAVMDISVEPFNEDKARRARAVAISVPMHTALRLGVAVAEQVRAVNPSCHICFYGLYAALNAEHLLSHGGNSVIGGETEGALVELIERLESGAPSGQSGTRPHLTKLDFPAPSRAALPSLKKYARLARGDRLELVAYVEASRGCKHLCRHCPIPPVYGGRFFVVPKDVVLADIRQQVEAGATHVTFGDPDFLNGPRHAMDMAGALHEEFPTVTFDVTAKVEHLLRQKALLPGLAAAGCAFVVSAVESLSDVVLGHLDKGHTRADVTESLHALRDVGIAMRPTWVPFTPWTTLDDYREMLDFVEREGLVDHVDAVQYSIRLLVPPGSLLVDSPAMRPHLGPLVERDFYHAWTHPEPAMDALHASVAALVSNAADAGEDAAVTFDRVRHLADTAAGASPRAAVADRLARDRQRPPHLTEPWFC
jgi:radical SAM superfamily enzyme YgiQ (UPF0313 family)